MDSVQYFNREAVYEKNTVTSHFILVYIGWIFNLLRKNKFSVSIFLKSLLFVIIKFHKDISLYKIQPSRQADKYLFDVSLATNLAISFIRYKVLVQSIKWRVWNKIQL